MQNNPSPRLALALLVIIAGFLLSASFPRAAELPGDPLSPLGTFNDFEEYGWKQEVLDVLKEGAAISRKGGSELPYVAFAHINLALNGNVYAAACLTDDSAFHVYPDSITEFEGTGEFALATYEFWKDYAEQATSPGWAAYLADIAEPRRYFSSGRQGRHPAAVYWYASKALPDREYVETPEGALLNKAIYECARKGYAYAQADLAAAYAMNPGASWVLTKEPDWQERMLALEQASARQGEPYGLYLLGGSYYMGLYGGAQDKETALMYYILGQRFVREKLRPGALSHPDPIGEDDSALLFGIRGMIAEISPTEEMRAAAEARADEWQAEFMKKREAAYAPVRAKRARLAAAAREKYRDDYIRVYEFLKSQGMELPPSIFAAGGHSND